MQLDDADLPLVEVSKIGQCLIQQEEIAPAGVDAREVPSSATRSASQGRFAAARARAWSTSTRRIIRDASAKKCVRHCSSSSCAC